jgi:peptidoglycan hydrolase CwlO-like protein
MYDSRDDLPWLFLQDELSTERERVAALESQLQERDEEVQTLVQEVKDLKALNEALAAAPAEVVKPTPPAKTFSQVLGSKGALFRA